MSTEPDEDAESTPEKGGSEDLEAARARVAELEKSVERLTRAKGHVKEEKKNSSAEVRRLQSRIKALESGEDPEIARRIENAQKELEEQHAQELSEAQEQAKKEATKLTERIAEFEAKELERSTSSAFASMLRELEVEDGPQWRNTTVFAEQLDLLMRKFEKGVIKKDAKKGFLIETQDDSGTKAVPVAEYIKALTKRPELFKGVEGPNLGHLGEPSSREGRSNLELVTSGLRKIGVR